MIGDDGSVGIWHETYSIQSGNYENIYVNMPDFGLGKAGKLAEVKAGHNSAHDRLNQILKKGYRKWIKNLRP